MDWDAIFGHPDSWPVRAVGMSRDVFERHKPQVLTAAKKHGYKLLGSTNADREGLNYHRAQVEFVGAEVWQ